MPFFEGDWWRDGGRVVGINVADPAIQTVPLTQLPHVEADTPCTAREMFMRLVAEYLDGKKALWATWGLYVPVEYTMDEVMVGARLCLRVQEVSPPGEMPWLLGD